ncbi:MFS transporter [Rhizobium sp. SSA_523]|uniref:MFS transporter n=1 Tax=Rhizobium sp. SSA_523 TaxID=2952477 RepID=UPI002091317F|nr:MFS transporter [Rhizobium sp. SSA_523]MCO5732310.1 MFS transporter [Rhizobium sp. SSA_523]WKC21288.1 MFS transporter [Rhizobium sp. SSA_523]
MRTTFRATWADPRLRVSAFAIFCFGTTGAATSPYQSIIGIQELGLSNSGYASLMFAAAVINVTASVMMGILADRLGNYRTSIIYVSLFGIGGFGLVYLAASAPAFVIAKLLLLPIFGALNSLIFANVRASSRQLSSADLAAVNSTIRATISLSWVLMPGVVGIVLAGASSMLPAYLIATLAAGLCFVLGIGFLPKAEPLAPQGDARRYRFLSSLGEVVVPRVALRIAAIALICSMLHINDAVRPLIVTGKAQGSVQDLGIVVGIVAALEIVFILFWGRAERWLTPVRALAIGAALYAVYLILQGLATERWHIYAQTLISGFAAAAIISLPITYLQDLIADRPGLGSSLIAVNIFLSAGLSAAIFALGTSIAGYGFTSILGAGVGGLGIILLLVLETRKKA